jgi:hypothetical protein
MTVGFVPSYRVLGVRVNAVEMAETVNLVTN